MRFQFDGNQAYQLRAIEAPTLVVTAEEDRSMPDDAAILLSERIPHAELVSMPGLAHLCTLQAPNAFLNILQPFLARVDEDTVGDPERSEPAHPW